MSRTLLHEVVGDRHASGPEESEAETFHRREVLDLAETFANRGNGATAHARKLPCSLSHESGGPSGYPEGGLRHYPSGGVRRSGEQLTTGQSTRDRAYGLARSVAHCLCSGTAQSGYLRSALSHCFTGVGDATADTLKTTLEEPVSSLTSATNPTTYLRALSAANPRAAAGLLCREASLGAGTFLGGFKPPGEIIVAHGLDGCLNSVGPTDGDASWEVARGPSAAGHDGGHLVGRSAESTHCLTSQTCARGS